MKNLNKRIVELRMLSGLDSGKLANLSGIKAQMFSHIENGRRGCTVESAVAIAEALKPFIGDRFDYLARGMVPSDFEDLKISGFSCGFIHIDDVVNVFRDVLARSARKGALVMSESDLNDLELNFILELSGKIGEVKEIKEG